jgi:hypothetical protein
VALRLAYLMLARVLSWGCCANRRSGSAARAPGALGHGVELAADERAAAIGLYDLDLEAVIWSDRDIGGGRA